MSIRYFNTLSKAAKIISLAFILCKLLAVKQSHPGTKRSEIRFYASNITCSA